MTLLFPVLAARVLTLRPQPLLLLRRLLALLRVVLPLSWLLQHQAVLLLALLLLSLPDLLSLARPTMTTGKSFS
jgi:hypothetical protein